jgi:type II secretory pathway pseudopilin PulG
MQELKRVYWSRQALRLGFTGATVWLVDAVAAAATLPVLCLMIIGILAAVVVARDVRRRDPVRRFTRQQRREGMARAAGQCEMEAGFRRRCSRPAEHGDHFYPWSKGGTTSLQNFVAACARCNRAKGARIPSPGQQARLERRRQDYLTPGSTVSIGERRPLR